MVRLPTTVPHRNPKEWRRQLAIARNNRWAKASERDRQAQSQAMTDAKFAKWAREIDPDGTMDPRELSKRLASRHQAHMLAVTQARQAKLAKLDRH